MEDTLSHEGAFVNTSQPMQPPYLLSDKDILKNNHIAYINPFRYRSYYYDTETNLYYLTTRYYDPETGRFINADDISYADPKTINELNLFAYCLNNPVMMIDSTGNSPKWWQWLLFGIGAALVIAATVVVSIATFGTGTAFSSIGGAILLGAAKGALIGAAVGSTIGIAGGAIYAGVTGANMGDSILQGFLMGLGIGAITGAVIGGISGYTTHIPNKITGYTKHGLQQALTRNGHGVSPKGILDAVKNPIKLVVKQSNGGYKFVGEKSITILNKRGKIITTIAKSKIFWRF